MENDVTKYYHGRLPQWRFRGAIYFITFSTKQIEFTPDERKTVYDAVLYWHNRRYTAICFSVMPDHVHMICTFGDEEEPSDLSRLVQSVKAHTARKVNKKRGRSGPLWEREFYNRLVRDNDEIAGFIEYIYLNPYRAELTVYPEEYPFTWFNEEIED